MKSNVYLLLFPEHNVLKIGKADDVSSRINKLRLDWGHPDYNNSYVVTLEHERVFDLEKSLHKLLGKYNVNIGDGDGHTEMFSIDCLELCLKYIEVFQMDTSNGDVVVTKGAPEIIQTPDTDKSKKKVRKTVDELREEFFATKCTAGNVDIIIAILTDSEYTVTRPNPNWTDFYRIVPKFDVDSDWLFDLGQINYWLEDDGRSSGVNLITGVSYKKESNLCSGFNICMLDLGRIKFWDESKGCDHQVNIVDSVSYDKDTNHCRSFTISTSTMRKYDRHVPSFKKLRELLEAKIK